MLKRSILVFLLAAFTIAGFSSTTAEAAINHNVKSKNAKHVKVKVKKKTTKPLKTKPARNVKKAK